MTRRAGRKDKPKPKPAVPFSLPSREEVLDFLSGQPDADLRTTAKAFKLKPGPEKIAFKKLFRELKDAPRSTRPPEIVPPEIVPVEITGRDADGELLCSLAGQIDGPAIVLAPGEGQARGDVPALGIGERFLAKLIKLDDGALEARVVRRLGASKVRIVGVYRKLPKFGRIESVSKKASFEFFGILPTPRKTKFFSTYVIK